MENNNYKFRERKRWGFLGLPFTFTVYKIGEELLTIDKGFINAVEDDCYMYKVQDAKLTRSLNERLFRMGTIICYTGDTTDRTIVLKHVRHCQEIKDYILKTSEEARMKRRTMNMQNIGAGPDMPEIDGSNDVFPVGL